MKILQVYKDYYPPIIGGIEKHLNILCNSLKPYADVEVLVANRHPKTIVERIEGITITKVAQLRRILSAPICPSFPIWLKRFHPDIIHFHYPNPTAELSALLTGQGNKAKVVVSYHSDIVRQAFLLPFYRPMLERFLSFADIILATSPNYIESSPFLSKFREKCAVVPYGIELPRFERTQAISKKISDIQEHYGEKFILFIGIFRYYKGIPYLLRAMKEVDGKLLLIGGGPLERELKRLVRELGVDSKVIFLGPIGDYEELIPYIYSSQVFVLPSTHRSEAFGIVQLEAMACEKPVVSTSLDTGVPFVNQHKVTGLVVPPKDSRALAEAINTLLWNEPLRLQYGRAGRHRVEKEFTKEIMMQRILRIYQELLNRN